MSGRLRLARMRQPDPGPLRLRLMRPFMRRMCRRMLAVWPKPVRGALVKHRVPEQRWQAGVRERSNMAEFRDDDFVDAPTIVMSPIGIGIDPGMRLFMPPTAPRDMTDGKRRMNSARGGPVTQGEERVLEDARRSTAATDQPDAVTQAIRDLLGMVRDKNSKNE